MTKIEAYQKAKNKIFEYRFESKKDKAFVLGALDMLCDELILANRTEIDQIKADILRIG